eukprot:Tamp_33543.p1 GENE.Tamp_33543~~Tamp_33543.p1  ORF type:complete len:173 (-),score=27.89 Tamp_33543:12-530(-)
MLRRAGTAARASLRAAHGAQCAAAATRPPRKTTAAAEGILGHGMHRTAGAVLPPAMRRQWSAPTLFFVPARGMARYEGEMPQLGPDEFVITSPEVSGPGGMSVPAELGEIVELLVDEGDEVKEDMIVAEIETCKASVEARCRTAGVVKKLLVQDGEEVWELQPLMIVSRKSP